jgi:hypothetical protein
MRGRVEIDTSVKKVTLEKLKRGVPRLHENMRPGNSFPQICVVSRNKNVEKLILSQEYLGTMAHSNHKFTN